MTSAFRHFRFTILLLGILVPPSVALAQSGLDSDGDGLADTVDPNPTDPYNGGWKVLPTSNGSTLLSRHESDCIVLSNQIAVMGGRETSVVEYYDPIANTWTKTGSAPLTFHHFQAAYVNGLVYVICAFVGPYPNETPVPDIYIYNPTSKTWSKGPSIPVDRRRGASATGVYNGKIYIAGGNTKGHNDGWVAWFDEFNPATGTWTRLPDAPRPRDHHRAAVIQGRLYLVSGRRSSANLTSVTANTIKEIDVYDYATSAWFTMPNGIPTLRAGCGVIPHGREVIILAGENTSGALANVEALDVVTGAWRIFPNLKQKRNSPVAAAIGNNLFVNGGQGAGNNNQETMLQPPRPLPVGQTGVLGEPINVPLQPVISLDCGGTGSGGFVADANFSGGTTTTTSTTVTTPIGAPQAVYQSERTGNFSYSFGALDPTSYYRLSLNFVEFTFGAAGQRKFDVTLNGILVLDDFDIFTAAGAKNKAVDRVFTIKPLSNGTISLQFSSVVSDAKLSGLSVSRLAIGPVGSDRDGDGYPDAQDAFPDNSAEWLDSDGDGVGNNSDAFPNNAAESKDTDNDGTGDNSDAFPNNPAESKDTDGDGTGDNSDAFPNNPAESKDTDNDGIGDNSDPFPNDPNNGGNPSVELITNGSFESTTPNPIGFAKLDEAFVPGWQTNNPTNKIEVWQSGYLGIPAQNGNQCVEMDGFSVERTLATTPGAVLNWSFWHRGRDGNDTVALNLGVPGTTLTRIGTYVTGQAWVNYKGSYVVPAGQTQTQFALVAIAAASSMGAANVIDNISVKQTSSGTPGDQDGDGVLDAQDAFPINPLEWNDTDNDGVGDNSDAFPANPAETKDTDGDGVGDNSDRFPTNPAETKDTDNDGLGDNSDPFPNDPTNGGTGTELILNGSFENTTPKPTGFLKLDEAFVPGWQTNNPTNKIEVWKTGYLGIPAQDGIQCVEMDGFSVEQTIATTPGAVLNWSFWHRGRDGNDTVALDLGSPGTPLTRIGTYVTGKAWVNYKGSYVVPAGQTQTRFALIAVAAASSMGAANVIDNISVKQVLPSTPTALVAFSARIDTDRDLVPDVYDALPNDATDWTDSDGDGVGDNRDLFPKDRSTNGKGRYTLLLPVPGGVTGIGDGYGLLTLDASLKGTLQINMGDNSQFVQRVTVKDGVLSVNATGTRPHTGDTLKGNLSWSPRAGVSDFNGTLEWIIKEQPTPISVTTIGSLYKPSSFPTQLGTNQITVDLMGAPTDLSLPAKITGNKLQWALSKPVGTFNPNTGYFTWPIIVAKKKMWVEAVYFEDQQLVSGFFHDGKAEVGVFRIAP